MQGDFVTFVETETLEAKQILTIGNVHSNGVICLGRRIIVNGRLWQIVHPSAVCVAVPIHRQVITIRRGGATRRGHAAAALMPAIHR